MVVEKRQSQRLLVVMPEEEPVGVQTPAKLYTAKLVNLGSGGALISILDCIWRAEIGSRCTLSLANSGHIFEVQAELLRVVGWYAAFKFVDLTAEQSSEIGAKIAHIQALTEALCPVQ